MKILVTGAAGFIGSHTCVELEKAGYEVVGVDNFVNSNYKVIECIEKIIGKKIIFYNGDVTSKNDLRKIFETNTISAVIHFAAFKSVNESIKKPLSYYCNNVYSTVNLCKVMQEFNCKKIIFSSSATVYGNSKIMPVKETFDIGNATNPYGSTKIMCEKILKDLYDSDKKWSVCILRYFNPIGAHESGLIGEEVKGTPNNLMPYIVKVAAKKLSYLNIFGNDYPTYDGTCIRDFIHVVDLAKGHISALNKILNESSLNIYNLGTGRGYSVLELVKEFEQVNKVNIPYLIKERRAGDIAICYADAHKAFEDLGWSTQKNISDMCKDSWNFYIKSKGGKYDV